LCHCLSISYRSSVVVSGIVRNVIKLAAKEAYPLYRKRSFSPTKLKSIDAIKAPAFPADADIPWHMARILVGNTSAEIKNVVELGPH
jgi:hypothetical protein